MEQETTTAEKASGESRNYTPNKCKTQKKKKKKNAKKKQNAKKKMKTTRYPGLFTGYPVSPTRFPGWDIQHCL
jgi:hypothetical protein